MYGAFSFVFRTNGDGSFWCSARLFDLSVSAPEVCRATSSCEGEANVSPCGTERNQAASAQCGFAAVLAFPAEGKADVPLLRFAENEAALKKSKLAAVTCLPPDRGRLKPKATNEVMTKAGSSIETEKSQGFYITSSVILANAWLTASPVRGKPSRVPFGVILIACFQTEAC
jgi:hypothetical protein